jgi:hypothetical protein
VGILKVNIVKFWFIGVVILVQVLPALGQNTRRNTRNFQKKPIPVDTVIKQPATAMLTMGHDCKKGITDILVEIAPTDTATIDPTWLYIYAIDEANEVQDTAQLSDTLHPYLISTITEIEKNNYRLYLDKPGKYFVRTATGNAYKPVLSKNSDTVSATFCSVIEFQSIFNRYEKRAYTPGPFINIQIQEFDIFDRMGNTAYHHKNNDISWDGNYPNHTPCPAGIYYYHCSYIDLTNDDGEKKSLSGMIELKD